MTPLLLAARQGYTETVQALLDAGVDVNQLSAGRQDQPAADRDDQRPLRSREAAARPRRGSESGRPRTARRRSTPRSTASGRRSRSTRSRARTSIRRSRYLDLVTALLDKGADPNARLRKKVWYSGYSFDLSGVDEIGATAFWRAAYASDVDGDEAARRARRRPEHPVDEGRRPPAHRVTSSAKPSTSPRRRRSRRRPGRAAAGRGRRQSGTAKASPPTRIASRRPACSPP